MQWNKYQSEFVLRRQVGVSYYNASVAMASMRNVAEMIFEILKCWRELFSGCDFPQLNIPTKIFEFMYRCGRAEAAQAEDKSIDRVLLPDDADRLHSLIIYVRGIFTIYANLWAKFSSMERSSTSHKVSTRPDLIVADLELDLLSQRTKWSSRPEFNGPQHRFFHDTW